jgi:dynein heavy chain
VLASNWDDSTATKKYILGLMNAWHSLLSSAVRNPLQVQRNWMYLENIFIGSEDIRKQLPQESIMFESVHNTFTRLMKQLAAVHNCLKVGVLHCLTP